MAEWEAWFTLGLIALMAFALIKNWAGPDTVLLGGLGVLMCMRVTSDAFPEAGEMVAGFGNEAVVTIGVLFVVAAGLTQTGAMSLVTQAVLGRPKNTLQAQVRMMPSVAVMSGFLNNTPIVAMFIPVVNDWCRKYNLSPSKLFIPLSYAAILGGACTLIGTSTNLIVYGLLDDATRERFGMFTIAWVGVPAALLGMVYVALMSRWLLPNRKASGAEASGEGRSYTIELMVEATGPLVGKTIERAGLRALPGVYLAEIERDGERLVAVGPEQALRANDRLIFVGQVDAVGDLQKLRGLIPAPGQVFKLRDPRPDRLLVEAVVSHQSDILGKTVRESRFRTQYNGVIIAVHREGTQVGGKIGDIKLQPGDALLIESHPRFLEQHRHSKDFYLMTALEGSNPLRHQRAPIALVLLALIVLLAATKTLPLVALALMGGGLMVVTGCCTPADARRAVEWRVLLAIGAAIGIGTALDSTGAAEMVGHALISVAEPLGPHGILAGIYLATMLFNMMIGHAGAAALAFPIAQAIAIEGDYNMVPFALAIMMAAVAEFAVPISYPTHLMVYGAGGYRVMDYVRFGLPLNFIVMAVMVIVAPLVFGF